jgi:hypothetical protein
MRKRADGSSNSKEQSSHFLQLVMDTKDCHVIVYLVVMDTKDCHVVYPVPGTNSTRRLK